MAERCVEINPQSQQCVRIAGHAGAHDPGANSNAALMSTKPSRRWVNWLAGGLVVVIAILALGAIGNSTEPSPGGRGSRRRAVGGLFG